MVTSTETFCRMGLMSRIDFPSDGFRKGLLLLAAEIFQREDVRFIILAGGLVDSRYVKEKTNKLKKRISNLKKQLKALQKEEPESAKERRAFNKAVARLEADINRFEKYLDELSADKMAEQLARHLPVFKNGKGETIKLYIFPSPAYDGKIGEEVAELLAEKHRPDDVRTYPSGGDRLPIKQAQKIVEVLVPEKSPWRGDYFSTPAERVLKDKRRQSSQSPPDIQVVGCFGSTISKPLGESPRPYVTIPVLHRLHEVRASENQIGVRVMTVHKDRVEPVTRNFSFKDLVQAERQFIEPPKNLSKNVRKLVDLLKERGRLSTGVLADESKISREAVQKGLMALANRDGRRPKKWSGLRYDAKAKLWDLDGYWVRENLRYPSLPADRKVDSIEAFGCLHAGSIYADYEYFLETMPRVILEHGSTVLVAAGDLVEGTKHGLLVKGEVYGGMNVTMQETFAGELLSKIILDVFKVRSTEALARLPANPTADQITQMVRDCLMTLVVIPGNHDLWSLEYGFTPLVVMKSTIINRISEAIGATLAGKGHCLPCLGGLVTEKVIEPDQGEWTLPSGLKMAVLHPHMGRTKTTSIRPQEMMDKAADSHVVIGANFHVGEHLEVWEGELGQRVCIELGTIKRRSDFEDNKLKTVDHGFGYIRVESVNGRIVATENTFYGGSPSKGMKLNRHRVFADLLKVLNLK